MHYFPYTREEAYYNPLGQYIYMSRYDRDEFLLHAKAGVTLNTLKHMSVYIHEFRHWLDHIGTLWGQDFLIEQRRRMHNHLNGSADAASLVSPFVLPELLERNGIPQLLHKVRPKNQHDYWKWTARVQVAEGLPVFVLDFIDRYGNLLCTTPVTHTSLFEANALYEELHLAHHARKVFIDDVVERLIETNDEQWQYFQQSYDSEFIDYSAAMHITSAVLSTSHYFESYRIASIVSTVALNIPKDFLETIVSNSHAPLKYHRHLILNRDMGYLVYTLSMNYQKRYKESGHFVVNEFLSASGLPMSDVFENEIINAMRSNLPILSGNDVISWRIRRQIEQGIEAFRTRGIDGKGKQLLGFIQETELRPDIIFGDELWDSEPLENLLNLPQDRFGLHDWYDLVHHFIDLEASIKRFAP